MDEPAHTIPDVWRMWLGRLARLHVSKSSGDAPHKPLLLLVVLDLLDEGALADGLLLRDGNLAFRFSTYWSVVAYRRNSKPDIKLPLYHLKTDGFWTPLSVAGDAAAARELAVAARIDSSFLACAASVEFRLLARRTLIANYFKPQERLVLCEVLNMPPIAPQDAEFDRTQYAVEDFADHKREARFSLRVLPAYDFTCALTRYRMVSIDGTTAVDAAHIQQFKRGGPNSPTNGLALSKTAHWLFDRGFWSIGDDYRVLVHGKRFDEAGDAVHLLKPRAESPILLPRNPSLCPDRAYLAWHRSRHGFPA